MTEPQDKLTIDTPELIPLEFPLAGVGSRFLAVAVDSLVQFVISLALLVLGMLVFGVSPPSSHRLAIWLEAAGVIVVFLLQFGYFAAFEAWWNGQTPGKRHLHLRVIKESGRPITVYDSVARNLLRIVDWLPGFYGVGILSMLLSSKNKRLGDFVAGTVVVHEQPLEKHVASGVDAPVSVVPSGYDLSQLTADDFQLLEAFLMRREQLAPEIRQEMARRVVRRIAAKIQLAGGETQNPEALVETVAKEYRGRAQFS
jgi:uncharacterized RDD family membrane protein YckC